MKSIINIFICFALLVPVCDVTLSYGNEKSTIGGQSNELPMFGGVERTLEEKKADEVLIKSSIEQFGSKEEAVKVALKLAWNYYDKHDVKTAMKRFNQAWLLDPQNADVFYGFGFLLAESGDQDDAIRFYQRAIELNPAHAMAMCELARVYRNKAHKMLDEYKSEEEKEIWSCLDNATKLCENAIRSAKSEKDIGYIYYQWAVALELSGDYIGAWEKIDLSRKHDGRFVESGFVDELSSFITEARAREGAVSANSLGLDKRLFLTFEADKTKVRVDEPLLLNVKLYVSDVEIASIQSPVLLNNELSKPEFSEPKQSQTAIDGLSFHVFDFQAKTSATKAGAYNIGPARIVFYVTLADPVQQTPKIYFVELKSNSLEIVVK